jgi:hypothetical protein
MFIRLMAAEIKGMQDLRQGARAGMTEPLMPQFDACRR